MTAQVWRFVRADLRRVLLGVPGVPDIAYEARPYSPTSGVAYIREALEKGPAATATLSTFGTVEERGIYQLDLHWPAALTADGEDMADAIRLAYWHGRVIASSGPDPIRGQVTRSRALRVVPGLQWTVFPIRVEFFFRRLTAQGRAA